MGDGEVLREVQGSILAAYWPGVPLCRIALTASALSDGTAVRLAKRFTDNGRNSFTLFEWSFGEVMLAEDLIGIAREIARDDVERAPLELLQIDEGADRLAVRDKGTFLRPGQVLAEGTRVQIRDTKSHGTGKNVTP